MDKDKEALKKIPSGYAIVGRFIENEESKICVERIDLAPGEAVIFKRGKGYKRFPQSRLIVELQKKENLENFETLALCDIKSGGFLLTQGKDRSFCLNSKLPVDSRILGIKSATSKYVAIWEENYLDAEKKLEQLVSQKSTLVIK